MSSSSSDAAPPTDRQPRVRRVTGLIAAGAAIATAAVALPALAATTDAQSASSSETTVTSAVLDASTTVAPTPSTTSTSTSTSTTVPVPPAPTAEELLAAQVATYTPEQKLAFDLYVASPEQRAAWAAYISPPPPPAPEPAAAAPAATGGGSPPNAFLACVRQRESGGNYSISSGNGLYRGAYQFHQGTWNSTASHAGRGDLVGADPASVSPADQDAMAAHLYSWQGSAPWGGAC